MTRRSNHRGRVAATVGAILVVLTCAAAAPAVEDAVYRVPDQALVDIIDTPKTPRLSIGPTREWAVLISRPGYPSIAELAEPELKLAGLRIKPDSFSPSRVWPNNKLEFVRIEDLESRPVTGLPETPRIANVRWSPSGARVALSVNAVNNVRLYHSDRLTHYLASGTFALARRVPDSDLLFQDGVHLKYFDTVEEFFELAQWYLKHEDERMKIANAGMERVHAEFNGTKIAKYTLDAIANGSYDAPWNRSV